MQKVIQDDLLNLEFSHQIVKVLGILSNCSKVDSAKKYVAWAIGDMVGRDLFKDLTNDQILDLIRILADCFSQEDAKTRVLGIVSNLKEKGYFKNLSENECLEIENKFGIKNK